MSPLLPAAALLLSLVGPAAAQQPAPEADEAAEEPPPLLRLPQLAGFVQAEYPPEARAAGKEAAVRLLLSIDAEGTVTDVAVIEPVGDGFDEAAADAARQFRFVPALGEEGPVPVKVEYVYGFSVSGEGASNVAADTPAELQGTLVEMGTRKPLPLQDIFVVASNGAEFQLVTDETGSFGLGGLPPGPLKVVAAPSGYESAEKTIDLQPGELLEVRFWARNLSYVAENRRAAQGAADGELVVTGEREVSAVTRRTISMDEVRRIPGTFGDPVRVIQNLPGAARAPLGTGLLVIRGANPEDSGVYVDGIRIPLIYHLGGYSSVINADLVEAVDYLPGGFGTEYGRSTGGVIDVKTTRSFPEQGKVVWNTDALDSGALVKTRVGGEDGVGVAVAARRSYVDALIPLFTRDTGFTVKPRWYDYQLKLVDLDDGAPGEWQALIFGFEDVLTASTPPGFAQGTDPDTQGDLGTQYLTHRGYFEYRLPLSETLSMRLLPSLGFDRIAFNLGNGTRIVQDQFLLEGRFELPWTPSKHFALTPGIDIIAGRYWFETQLPFNPGTLGDFDPLDEREPWTVDGQGWGWGPDLYLDAAIRPLADTDKLLLNPGVRMNFVTITADNRDEPMLGPAIAFDPRLNARWQVVPGGTLKAGSGLYHQPPQPFESWRPEGEVLLRYERAWASEVGWEQQITDAVNADVAVFYKDLDNLIVQQTNFEDLSSQYFTNKGIGRIYGTEFMLRHALEDRFFGWISYTLSRSERNDRPGETPDPRDYADPSQVPDDFWYRFDFDQTHILVALAGYRLPRDFEISAKVQYVTGNPTTPFDGGVYDVDQDFYFGFQSAAFNSERLPPFFALDARVDKLFTFKRWQLEVYLDLLNAVRGQNPEFTLYNYDYTDSRFIRGLPFIPSPGFEARINL